MGITPEAIENNPIMYELMLEMAWHTTPVNLSTWVPTYAQSRYGAAGDSVLNAWSMLLSGAYSHGGIDTAIVEQSCVVCHGRRKRESERGESER